MTLTLSEQETEDTINRHISELHERIKTLQTDRKANIEIWEASRAGNLQETKELKEVNKKLRQQIATLQKIVDDDTTQEDIRSLEADAENLRRVVDTLQSKSTSLRVELREIEDQISVTEMMGQQPQLEDNDQLRKILHMENKLDIISIKLTDELNLKDRYAQSITALKDAEKGVNAKLSFLEKTSQARQNDLDHIIMLSKDAIHAQESAYLELERRRINFQADQKAREKTLADKLQALQIRKHNFERWKEQESIRIQLEESEKSERELQLYNSQQERTVAIAKMDLPNRLELFEDAFRKIKQVTGVSNVNEVIHKFHEQMIRTAELTRASNENQVMIDDLQCQHRDAKEALTQAEWAVAGSDLNHRFESHHEEELAIQNEGALQSTQDRFIKLSRCMALLQMGLSDALYRLNADNHEKCDNTATDANNYDDDDDDNDDIKKNAIANKDLALPTFGEVDSITYELDRLLNALEGQFIRRLTELPPHATLTAIEQYDQADDLALMCLNCDDPESPESASQITTKEIASQILPTVPSVMDSVTSIRRTKADEGGALAAARRNVKKASADLVRRMEHKQVLEQRRLARELIKVPTKPSTSNNKY